MNPSRTLMGLALALSLVIPATAAANPASDWHEIHYGSRVYYVHASELTALKPGQQAALYTSDKATQSAYYKLEKDASGKLYLVHADQKFAATDVTAHPGTTSSGSHPQGATGGAGAGPAGVDPDVRALVRGDALIAATQAARLHAEHMLQALKKQNPALYAAIQKVSATPDGKAKADQAIKTLDAQKAPLQLDAHISQAIAQALGLSDAPSAPSTGTGSTGTAQTGPAPTTPAKAETVIQKLNKAQADSDKKKDIQSAISQWVLHQGNDAFVDPKYRSGPGVDQRLTGSIPDAVGQWMTALNKPELVSKLYVCVMSINASADKLPAWSKDILMPQGKMILADLYGNHLMTAMKGWTIAVGSATLDGSTVKPGAYAGAPVPLADWVTALLGNSTGGAAKAANDAYTDTRSPGEIGNNIAQNDTGDNVPRVPGGSNANGGGSAVGGSGGGSFSEMFTQQGYVWPVTLKDGSAPRYLSIEIVSHTDPSSHQVVNELGIYDITSNYPSGSGPSGIYGRRFPVNQQGSGPQPLKTGGYPYNLSMNIANGDEQITIKGPAGQSASFTLSQLLQQRSNYVSQSAPVASINGQTFRVVGEPPGTYDYFAADSSGKLSGDPSTPALSVASVGQPPLDSNGNANPAAQSPMGFIGNGSDGNPLFYYSVWDPANSRYVAKSCVDLGAPCTFPAPAPSSTGTAGTSTTSPATTAPAPTGPGTTTPGTTSPSSTTPTPTPPSNQTAALSDCTLDPTSPSYSGPVFSDAKMFLVSKPDGKPWSYLLNPAGKGDGFFLCVDGDETISGMGIPVWKHTRESASGKYLIVESVSVDPPLNDPTKVTDPSPDTPKQGVNTSVGGSTVKQWDQYYIAKSKLGHDALATLKSNNKFLQIGQDYTFHYVFPQQVTDAMMVQVIFDQATVSNPQEAANLVDNAMHQGDAQNAPFTTDKASFDKIKSFVQAEVTKAKGAGLQTVKVNIHLFTATELPTNADGAPLTVVGFKDYASNPSDPVAKLDNLLYCGGANPHLQENSCPQSHPGNN